VLATSSQTQPAPRLAKIDQPPKTSFARSPSTSMVSGAKLQLLDLQQLNHRRQGAASFANQRGLAQNYSAGRNWDRHRADSEPVPVSPARSVGTSGFARGAGEPGQDGTRSVPATMLPTAHGVCLLLCCRRHTECACYDTADGTRSVPATMCRILTRPVCPLPSRVFRGTRGRAPQPGFGRSSCPFHTSVIMEAVGAGRLPGLTAINQNLKPADPDVYHGTLL
jgi:hypothetical protein